MNVYNRLLVVLLLIAVFPGVNAAWVESKGQAQILSDEIEIARDKAVQDALRQALLYAGANVNSIQEISHGLLTSDRFEVRSQGSVRDIQLINERHKNGYLSVTIRADIIREQDQCNAAQFTKTLVLTEFPLVERSQAATGAIFNLGKYAAQQLNNLVKTNDGNIKITQLLPLQQNWSNTLQPTNATASTSPFATLASTNNAQYVLTAQITDISIDQPKTKWLGLATQSPMRQFALNVFLYDGSNGEQVWNRQYQTQAPWHYSRQAQVDVSSNSFWQSHYGNAINDQLSQLYYDLNDRLNCEKVSGAIVKVESDQYTINLGTQHGINTNDILKVIHQGSFTDIDGITRQTQRISDAKLKIVQIGRYHLLAQAIDSSLAGGIQIRDRVIKE